MLPATAKLEKRKNSSLLFPGKAGAEGARWLSEIPISTAPVNWICAAPAPAAALAAVLPLLLALGAFALTLSSWKMLPEPLRIP